jgi:hypothetical protein
MKITEAFGYDEIEEACKGLTMEQFIQQYADEIFERSSARNPNTPVKVIKHACQIELDALIEHMTEHKEVIEWAYKVKQQIENKQE